MKREKHPITKIRREMPSPTKVQDNPKKKASRNACRKKYKNSKWKENWNELQENIMIKGGEIKA